MCDPSLAALLALAVGCGPPPPPPALLAPAEPRRATSWRPPPSPTAGLKRYAPVEARKDWGGAPVAPAGAVPGKVEPHGAMPGMSGHGMSGHGMTMPGMSMPGTDAR